jgi:hypothetical protein
VFELVKELTELPGPTGHEDAVQDWVEGRWSKFAQDVRRTRVNNILARVAGTGRRLLLVAHADEICLMVKSVTEEGFLHLWPYYSDQLGRPLVHAAQSTGARALVGWGRARCFRDSERPRGRRQEQPEGPV